jgi:AcrR family transcriptional regulator
MRELILDRAVELFNERGVEYVGIRELAKDLGLKGGNITYYFPTKDDLVVGVAERLRALNNATVRMPDEPSLSGYIAMIEQAFRNHYAYRGLFMSMPNMMKQNEKLAAGYVGTTELERRRVLREYLEALRSKGLLREDVTDGELNRAVSFMGLIARSWIGDASIAFRDRTPEWCMLHYRNIILDYLGSMATAKGRADLARVTPYEFALQPAELLAE